MAAPKNQEETEFFELLRIHGYDWQNRTFDDPMDDPVVKNYLKNYFIITERIYNDQSNQNQAALQNTPASASTPSIVSEIPRTPEQSSSSSGKRPKRYNTPQYFNERCGAHRILMVSSFKF